MQNTKQEIKLLSNRDIDFWISKDNLGVFTKLPESSTTESYVEYKFLEPCEVDNTVILHFIVDYCDKLGKFSLDSYSFDIIVSIYIFAQIYGCPEIINLIDYYIAHEIFPQLETGDIPLSQIITRDLLTLRSPDLWYRGLMRGSKK